MRLMDTHTHLYLSEFDPDRSEVINRAIASGVEKMLLPNIDSGSIPPMLTLCEQFKGICFPMIGLHPTSVKENYREELDIISKTADNGGFVAIGEIGLDLYWDKTFINEQVDALSFQIDLAIRKNLPIAVHTREAMDLFFEVARNFNNSNLRGVMHAFSGSVADAHKAVDMGFMLGIGGPVTYKKSNQAEVIRELGIGRAVYETDSPYLSPVPYRGKRNESSYIRAINDTVAGILGIDPQEAASITYGNSCALFGISI